MIDYFSITVQFQDGMQCNTVLNNASYGLVFIVRLYSMYIVCVGDDTCFQFKVHPIAIDKGDIFGKSGSQKKSLATHMIRHTKTQHPFHIGFG